MTLSLQSPLQSQRHLFFAPMRSPWVRIASFTPDRTPKAPWLPPGSKSLSNRAAILGALSRKDTTISGFLFAQDTYWCLEALSQLGYFIDIHAPSHTVQISAPRGPCTKRVIHCGSAGTLARFLPALLLHWPPDLAPPDGFCLTGSPQLEARPLAPLCRSLAQWGARLGGESLPLTVLPSELSGTTSVEATQSGQFLSGLILAAAANPKPLTILCPGPVVHSGYVHMTIEWAQRFGAPIDAKEDLHHISHSGTPQGLPGCPHVELEPDASTAAPLLAAAALFGFPLTIGGLGRCSSQPDAKFYSFLEQLGFVFKVEDHVTTVCAYRRPTPKDGYLEFPLGPMADQTPCAAIAALWATQPVVLTEIGHIRYHETNRIKLLMENFQGLGLALDQPSADSIRVMPPLSPFGLKGQWHTGNDHRFAMAGLLLALGSPQVSVEEPQCVEKTVPLFCQLLERLGAKLIPCEHPTLFR